MHDDEVDLDDAELKRVLRTPRWTDQLRDRVVNSTVARELTAIGMVDESSALGDLTRLRVHHELVVVARDRIAGLRRHLLDGYIRETVAALLGCAMRITAPTVGLPGGWQFSSTVNSVIPPLLSQLPADVSPKPDAGTAFPIWRSEAAATAALDSLRSRDWSPWPHSQHMVVKWTNFEYPFGTMSLRTASSTTPSGHASTASATSRRRAKVGYSCGSTVTRTSPARSTRLPRWPVRPTTCNPRETTSTTLDNLGIPVIVESKSEDA